MIQNGKRWPALLRRNAMRYVVAAGRRLAILAANGLLANDDDLDGNPLTTDRGRAVLLVLYHHHHGARG